MANRIQLRRDLAANFTASNPILAQGEPALEIDTLKEKIGNGTTAWITLPYRYQTITDENINSLYDAWSVGGMNVRAYATNCPILDEVYTAAPITLPLTAAPTTIGFSRKDWVVLNTSSQIVVLTGTAAEVAIAPNVDRNLYFPIRELLTLANATSPIDPNTGQGITNISTLYAEFGTEAGGESNVTSSNASIVINNTVSPINLTKDIKATNVQKLHEIRFDYTTTQSTSNKTHFNFKLKLDAVVPTNRYWFFRLYNGTSLLNSFLFKHGQYGFNANDLGLQYVSIPIAETQFIDKSYTKATLFFYHNSTTIPGYAIDDVEFLNGYTPIAYQSQVQSDYNQTNPASIDYIKNRENIEKIANKQNSLATDGTGVKYPTVDAVNAGLATKLDASAYNQHFKGKYLTAVAMRAAHPTASVGDSAQVNEVGATTVVNYSWDDELGDWVITGSVSGGATNTDELPEGTVNLYFNTTRVLATVLTGISFLTGTAVVATDTVLVAFGKLQKQINDLTTAVGLNTAKETNATHTGEVTGSGALTIASGVVDRDNLHVSLKTRITNATVTGTYTLDHALGNDWKLTLTGITTIAESNLPTGTDTIEFTMKVTGNFGLTVPAYWTVLGDTYDGTIWNFFTVQIHKGDATQEATCFISNF